jgi:poly(A) polymerase
LCQIEVTASNKEDFDVWEGWVHSRMRLLIRSAGMMVDVRPWPKAFKPPADEQAEQQANGSSDGIHSSEQPRCFYFMGLSKKKASKPSVSSPS